MSLDPAWIVEDLSPSQSWLRIARPNWRDPLDPTYSGAWGGRWNPRGAFPTLYFNGDLHTARYNLRRFAHLQGYEPEDLLEESAPILVEATLPRGQSVVDAHSEEGLEALGLAATYPLDEAGAMIGWERCQPIGAMVQKAGLRGIHGRSTEVPDRSGRELAWFPATQRSRAHLIRRLDFADWYW
ncbi:MAG: RES family NAD+ phosphorylase [Thermoanaerobaculia bacterium]|nr:RES family NAD+ phosphorylase [Thermoanaerobaculia bacterium]